jgi:predicted dehydrogenase
MRGREAKRIGLAIVGAGRVGLFRGEVARDIRRSAGSIAEKKPERAVVAEKLKAYFVTADYRELLRRPETNAVIVSTDEHLHVDPILATA